ncbi:MAG TPA: hypothetical protein VN324_05340, partial [Quisquiliibacterium sp.]|nr:hypothetical protein [Quisquiliibacterium sp.]
MRLGRWLALPALAALALLAAVLGWSLTQPGVLRWAAERAVTASAGRLQLDEVRGSLAGGLEIGELRWRGDPAAPGLELVLRGVRADLRLRSLLRGEVDLGELRAVSVQVVL